MCMCVRYEPNAGSENILEMSFSARILHKCIAKAICYLSPHD